MYALHGCSMCAQAHMLHLKSEYVLHVCMKLSTFPSTVLLHTCTTHAVCISAHCAHMQHICSGLYACLLYICNIYAPDCMLAYCIHATYMLLIVCLLTAYMQHICHLFLTYNIICNTHFTYMYVIRTSISHEDIRDVVQQV